MSSSPSSGASRESGTPCRPAQIAIYLIRSMTNLSLDDIGKEFDNRDHSTVLYSIQQVEKKMKKDACVCRDGQGNKTNINAKR